MTDLAKSTGVYGLSLLSHANEDLVVAELQGMGWEFLYSTEEGDVEILYLQAPKNFRALNLPAGVKSAHSVDLPEIDWEAQWEAFAPGYANGLVHLSVGERELFLRPGPGFGDCSHPTTQLVLEALPALVAGQSVLDVGTGSGVLAIAAAGLGAEQVLGTDIDAGAVLHATENVALNSLDSSVNIQDASEDLPKADWDILLLNMIRCEQDQAWAHISKRMNPASTVLVSGLRMEDDAESIWQGRGYRVVHKWEKDGWQALQLQLEAEC